MRYTNQYLQELFVFEMCHIWGEGYSAAFGTWIALHVIIIYTFL